MQLSENWPELLQMSLGLVLVHMTEPLSHCSLEWQIITPKSDKSPFEVIKKSKIQKCAVLPTNYTEIPSLTTHKYKNEFYFLIC